MRLGNRDSGLANGRPDHLRVGPPVRELDYGSTGTTLNRTCGHDIRMQVADVGEASHMYRQACCCV